MASVTLSKTPLVRAGLNISTAVLPTSSTYKILNCPETAVPGQRINIQGEFPVNAVPYLALNDGAAYIALPVVDQQVNALVATIPSTIPLDVYRVFVAFGGNASNKFTINRARGFSLGQTQVYNKAPMYIMGYNLAPLTPNTKPVIRFVNQSGGAVSYGTYISEGSHEFKLNYLAPAGLTTGAVYNVFVTNGSGNTIAETQVNGSLTALAEAVDVWNIGVPWGSKFAGKYTDIYNVKTDSRLTGNFAVGDGTTNDYAAIQNAINVASGNGGGVVYLPAGTYKFFRTGSQFTGLDMAANVVVTGAGITQTIINFGSTTGNNINKMIYFDGSKTSSGIANMTLNNVHADGTTNNGAGLINGKEFFLKSVVINNKAGEWLEFASTADYYAVVDTTITQTLPTSGQHGLISTPCKYGLFRNSIFTGVYGVNHGFASNLLVEGCTFNRDNALGRTSTTIHVVTSHYVTESLYWDNNLPLLNGPLAPAASYNDGETFIAEDPSTYDVEVGTATGATSTTLVDSTKSWSTSFFGPRPCVAIIDGKGVGQIRELSTTRTATTLTVTRAWDIIPDSTSVYSITMLLLRDTVFYKNSLRDQQRGFTFYFATMYNVAIVENSLFNSGSIDLNTVQIARTNNGATGTWVQFTTAFSVRISKNKVDCSNALTGAFIGCHFTQNRTAGAVVIKGSSVINLQIIGNILKAKTPNTDALVDANFVNAFLNYTEMQSDYSVQIVKPVLWGTVIQDNISADTLNGIKLNTHSHLTTIVNHTNIGVTTNVLDETLPNMANGSVKTTII